MSDEEKELIAQGYLLKLLGKINSIAKKLENYEELRQVFYDCIDIINKIEELEHK